MNARKALFYEILLLEIAAARNGGNLPQCHPRESEDELEQSDFSAPRDSCSLSLSLSLSLR